MKTFITLFILAHSVLSLGNEYTFEDLKVLDANNEFKEFFEHAKDIPPIKRDEQWEQSVQSMGERYVQKLATAARIEYSMLSEIDRLFEWKSLRKYEFFRKARFELGLSYFRECFKIQNDQAMCFKQLQQFYQKDNSDPNYGPEIVKILHYSILGPEELNFDIWPFLQTMLVSEQSEFYCAKEYISPLIIKKAMQMARGMEKVELEQALNKLAHTDCWKVILPKFNLLVSKAAIREQRDLAFKILQARNKLTTELKSRYLMLHLLEGPNKSEGQRLAWDWLKSIKNEPAQRSDLNAYLKQFDPLPGKIFSRHDKQSKVILKYLTRNFPEYIDTYAQTCLKYLEGSEVFEKGNPTIECHDLFSQAKELSLLPSPIIKRYHQLKIIK